MPKTNRLLQACTLLLLTACLNQSLWAQSRAKTTGKAQNNKAPEWVNRKPTSAQYYVGIGSAGVTNEPAKFQEGAKLAALSDMSSEIVVGITGETNFTQTYAGGKVDDNFKSDIKAITENNLEGYELVDSYNDGALYWVYYRLDKALYIANKRKRFNESMSTSQNLLARGQELEKAGDIYQSFLTYTQAIEPLLPFLVKALEPEFKGKATEHNSQIVQRLVNILANTSFEATNPEPVYKFGSKQDLPLDVQVLYKTGGQRIPVSKFPVRFKFEKGAGKLLNEYANSDKRGQARGVINKIEAQKGTVLVVGEFNTADFGVLQDKRVSLFTIGNLALPKASFRIKAQGPSVSIVSQENSLGNPLAVKVLEPMIKDYLTQKGCTVVPAGAKAEFTVMIKADTRRGTSTAGTFQALMTATISAVNTSSEDEVATQVIQDLKGVKFDFENASNDCYSKARKKLTDEFLPQFVDKLFN